MKFQHLTFLYIDDPFNTKQLRNPVQYQNIHGFWKFPKTVMIFKLWRSGKPKAKSREPQILTIYLVYAQYDQTWVII